MMNRRALLATTLLAPLAACASGAPSPSQVIVDVQSIAGGLSAVLPTILAAVGVGTATAAQISGYVADVQAAASALGKATASAAASPLAQQIIADVQAVAPIALAIVGLPPSTVAVIQAALSLLPAIAAALGLTSAPSTVPTFDPATARLLLLGASARSAP